MRRAVLGLALVLTVAAGRCPAQVALAKTDPQPVQAASVKGDPNTAPACAIAFSCQDCAPSPCIWGGADYMLWWVRHGPTPPLVVTGSPADPFPGALDQPGTRVLFGDQGLRYGALNGVRLNLGAWLDPGNTLGIEAGGFVLQQGQVQFNARGDANGQPFLATPFVNALTGAENVYFVAQNFANPAIAAFLTGGVNVASTSSLWSWEVHGVANLARAQAFTADLLVGLRRTSLREDLSYTTSVSNLTPAGASLFLTTAVPPGFTVTTFDQFSTTNVFNGGQAGLRLQRVWSDFGLEAVGKLALGNMHESVAVAGLTATNAPLPITQAPGGIFAQASNSGTYRRDVFAVIPEAGVNARVRLTPSLTAGVGYTFLYVSNVARPGDQLDRTLNINRVPIDAAFGTPGGPNRPAAEIHGSGFWAQGVNFGLEWQF